VSKDSIKPGTQTLSGAEFSVTGPNSYSTTLTTGSDGTACVDHLPFGSYSVTETKAPAGYKIDDTTAHSVPVNANAVCGAAKSVDYPATDTPLTDLLIKVTSEASGGTQSSIKCVNKDPANFATGTDIGNSPQPASGFADPVQVDANGTTNPSTALAPGTYTCKVVVDP